MRQERRKVHNCWHRVHNGPPQSFQAGDFHSSNFNQRGALRFVECSANKKMAERLVEDLYEDWEVQTPKEVIRLEELQLCIPYDLKRF